MIVVTAVRSALFMVWYLAWNVFCGLIYLPTLPLPTPFPDVLVRIWGLGVVHGARLLVGIRWRVEGIENMPAGPCIFACKHQSAWETMFLPILIHRFRFVLKKELIHIPLIGWYMGKHGSVAIDRKGGAAALKHMLRGVEAALDAGRQVIIFPEGTRTLPLAEAPYHPGVAALYGRFGERVPVVPVALNTGLFWSKNAFLKRPGEIVVRILPPIPGGLDRKTFTEVLRERIESESRTLCTPTAS